MSYQEKFVRAEKRSKNNSFERISNSNPVDISLGINLGKRAIKIVCSEFPPGSINLKGIGTERIVVHNKSALILNLEEPKFTSLFNQLAEDLDYATRQQPGSPGRAVVDRLLRWEKVLANDGTPDLLSDDDLLKLAGELDFLLNRAIPAVGPEVAIAAWRGPFDAPKDFVFNDVEVEVKSLDWKQPRLFISSPDQLNDSGVPLFICTRVVVLAKKNADDLISFPTLIDRCRQAVSSSALAREGLERCLRAAMWGDKTEYATRQIRFGPTACYLVDDAFPRLQRKHTPNAIIACSYELSLPQLQEFRTNDWWPVNRDKRPII